MRQIQLVLYRLKRDVGLEVVITTPTTNTHNVATGVISRVYTSITIKRAIVMSDNQQNISKLQGLGKFNFGGFFNFSKRIMILDKFDLPSTYTPSINDSCTFNGEKWEFEEITTTADNNGFLVRLNKVEPA